MSKIRIKEGVELCGMSVQILMAAQAALALWNERWPDVEVCITSATDSRHGRGSKHYVGNAIDIRTHTLPGMETVRDGDKVSYVGEAAETAKQELQGLLGSEFDVVLEGTHLHVEWDPKD